ncbi:MAG: glycosyltransferase [Planctomycetes bacterium]|nr:glycosyltransferase [Planctomycetota bacterium]MCW8135579.1 glycosyltransferase [Planctomycetota bacterium]
MKVLHVIPGLSAAQGGLQSALLNLCLAQRTAGITPAIAALHEDAPPDPGFDEFETHLFKCNFRPTGASNAMKHWLRQHSADYAAIVGHSIWRDPLLYAAQAPNPLVIMAHGMLDRDAVRHRAWRKALRLTLRLPDVLARATVVYTCAGEQQRSVAHSRAAAVIPLAVSVPDNPPPASPGGPIVCLGRVDARKGTLEWVNALNLLAQRGDAFRAVHAGPVENARYHRRVREAAQPLDDRLGFLGPLPYADAQQLLRAAGVVVAPCAVAENFGMVIAEALAAARTVVAGRRGLIVPELEAEGALLGAEHDAGDYARAIQAALQSPGSSGLLGYQLAKARFAPAAVGQAWHELLRNAPAR